MKTKKRTPKRPGQRARVAGYSERERCIFEFWDGSKDVRLDPLQVQAELLAVPDFEANLKLSQLESEEAQGEARKAFQELIPRLRKVFQVEEYRQLDNGRDVGLTQGEVMGVLVAFLNFLADVRKKLVPSPTSVPSSAGAEPADNSATSNTSASTSTETAPSTDEPSASPSV